jgi:ubiquinone/menaquinone biosynthesis C-methylase UbiE
VATKNDKAGQYEVIGHFYDLFDYPFEVLLYKRMRKRWISNIRKESVLEIGVGTGKNIPYYHPSNNVIGLDRESNMIRHAFKRNSQNKIKSNVSLTLQKETPWKMPQKKFSQIVATFVFCTMSDPTPVLDEMTKWVNKGTKLLIFEYIKAKNPKFQSLINYINPITKSLFGVNFNRSPTHEYFNGEWEIVKRTDIVNDFIIVIEAVKT